MQPQNRLKHLTVPQLWERLRNGLSLTADGLRMAAEAYAELMERGVDVSDLDGYIFTPYLKGIASGKILPELVIACGGSPDLLAAVATVGIREQRRLSKPDIKIPVVAYDGTVADVKPVQMSVPMIRQVFRDGAILSAAEQRTLAKFNPPREPPKTDTHFLNIATHLTTGQLRIIQDSAKVEGIKPAKWVVNFLVAKRGIPET